VDLLLEERNFKFRRGREVQLRFGKAVVELPHFRSYIPVSHSGDHSDRFGCLAFVVSSERE
jgi:hypothetical protein